jgi:hypothetical protein
VLIGWIALGLGAGCALALLCDIALRGHHQRTAAMDVVWPLMALYLGPLAAWLYVRHARPATRRWMNGQPDEAQGPEPSASAEHIGACGAGCLLGTVAAAGIVQLLSPAPVLPLEPDQTVSLLALAIADLSLAGALGLAFQRLSSAERDARRSLATVAMFQAALLACTVFNRLVLSDSPQPPPVAAQWLTIQVGLAVGFMVCWAADGWRHPSTRVIDGATIRGWRRA